MTSKMELGGMVKSKRDPCLFIENKVMAIIYIDDISFCSVNVNYIHKKAREFRKQGNYLEQKEDEAGFLAATLGWDEATGLM